MKTLVRALAVAFVATIGAGSAAEAAVSVIDFSAVANGTVTYSGPTLGSSTVIDLTMATLTVSSIGADDNASGLSPGNPISLSPMTIAYGSGGGPNAVDIDKTWTGTTGSFLEHLDTATIFRVPGSNFITVELTGWVTGPAGSGFDMTPAQMLLSATQVAGPGGSVSVSLTNTAHTSAIPEPSTWMMLALGFGGLAYAAVRRSAKDRTALAI